MNRYIRRTYTILSEQIRHTLSPNEMLTLVKRRISPCNGTEVVLGEHLCENVSGLFLGTDGVNLDEPIANVLMKMMIDNIDVFRPGTKFCQTSELDCTGVIFKNLEENAEYGS